MTPPVDHRRRLGTAGSRPVARPPRRSASGGMAREIVLDTETTGFDPLTGDRLVELAALEIESFVPTGRSFHVYIDPLRDMPAEAEKSNCRWVSTQVSSKASSSVPSSPANSRMYSSL